MTALAGIPRSPYEANLRLGTRNSLNVAHGTYITRYMNRSIRLWYNLDWLATYKPDGTVVLAPQSSRNNRRTYAARLSCVVPPGWEVRHAPGRLYMRLHYRDAYRFALSNDTVEFPPTGGFRRGNGAVMSQEMLDHEASAWEGVVAPPGRTTTVHAWGGPAGATTQPGPVDDGSRVAPDCWCAGALDETAEHGQYNCYMPATEQEAREAWERAQAWLQPAIAEYRQSLGLEFPPTCDICGLPEDQDPTNGRENDWNGETGNHLSCEEIEPVMPDAVLHNDRYPFCGPTCPICGLVQEEVQP